jgi:hypothetical protein
MYLVARGALSDAFEGVKWPQGNVSHAQAWGEAFEHAVSALGKDLKLRERFVVVMWSIRTCCKHFCSSDAEYQDNEPLIRK